MPECLVALGSNLGPKAENLQRAIDLLAADAQTDVLACSRPLSSIPIGGPAGQPEFLNGVVRLHTRREPLELLAQTQEVQDCLGRKGDSARWSARQLDLDILLYGIEQIDCGELTVPHPRMCVRRFVLEPALEIAPDWLHPGCGWTLRQLFENLTTRPYFALTGPSAEAVRAMADSLGDSIGARVIHDDVARADSAGRKSPAPIELRWRRRVLLVASFEPPADHAGFAAWQKPRPAGFEFKVPIISSFWSEAHDAPFDGEGYMIQSELLRAMSAPVIHPKLLVVLDAPSDWLEENCRTSEQHLTTQRWERRRRIMWRAIRHANCAPHLVLDLRDLNWARTQLTTAVRSMN